MPTDAQGGSQNAPERQKLAPLVREFRTHNLIIAGCEDAPKGASSLPRAPLLFGIPNVYNNLGNLLSLKEQPQQLE